MLFIVSKNFVICLEKCYILLRKLKENFVAVTKKIAQSAAKSLILYGNVFCRLEFLKVFREAKTKKFLPIIF